MVAEALEINVNAVMRIHVYKFESEIKAQHSNKEEQLDFN